MSRVLVTGGTGFIGRYAVEALWRAGWEVHVASRSAAEVPGARVHRVDLLDGDATAALVAALRPPALLHLAWEVTPGTYTTSLDNLRWVQSSMTLVEAFRRAGGRRLVCAGTSGEYDWRRGACREFDTPLAPATLYAACKMGVGAIVDRLAAQEGLSAAWGRVFFLYGPGEAGDRLLPTIVRAVVRRQPVPLRRPQQQRDFLHVADVGGAFAALLASPVDGPVNLSSGRATALHELVTRVAAAAGVPPPALAAADTTADPYPVVVGDAGRLTNEVNFTPRFDLDRGIDDAVRWWKPRLAPVQA